MTTVMVSVVALVALVLAVVVFVNRRDRNRLSSEEDATAVHHAGADQHRHEAERHLGSGITARNVNPPSV
ncbi:hypothetical protein O7598_16000 [Micromonospora sp. WMMC241]|uniref:hypothetical protein n=1 Tax=Micromonospora sp. WMMC241 TaxID=3015159 RepID=UPI0022B656F9|nr:hypothetical protein [Micromonospora sp. WMMC241]MCZ7437912.1 hypothetical protein [Micromonospora sp. WMMC241]